MDEPRWLADEMVGRLARYLRFLGYDTEYVRGASDDLIVERARRETRILLTRDRALASRVPGAIWLNGSALVDQLRAVRTAFPSLSFEARFLRCSLCNGELDVSSPLAGHEAPGNPPGPPHRSGVQVYACRRCGHLYWEGSHTADVRRRLRSWFPAEAPG